MGGWGCRFAEAVGLRHLVRGQLCFCGSCFVFLFLLLTLGCVPDTGPESPRDETFVLTQLPAGTGIEQQQPQAGGMLPVDYCEGAHIILLKPGAEKRVLTNDFRSACDPDISFDGKRILFAGKRKPADDWNIFEMELDEDSIRQVTTDAGDCRSPVYQGTVYTIISKEPWHQITFVGNQAGELNEYGEVPSTSLYTCMADGSRLRRISYNPSSDMDPVILPDGRVLFSSWQRSTLERGFPGRISLFAMHTDGVDYALFSGDEGKRVKRMPCVTTDRLVVFVENDSNEVPWDGAGTLASVSLRRNLHSYRPITRARDGLFHSPSPLPDGNILVSRRPAGKEGTHGLYRLDPRTGQFAAVFDDPEYHDIQARVVAARPPPDGRSSVVTEANPNGKLYCLNVYQSDLAEHGWIPPGTAQRLRVLEGVPRANGNAGTPNTEENEAPKREPSPAAIPPLIQRRFLGEFRIEQDGSFNVEVPANVPIQLQLLDADGLALRSCGWIWVRNRETRGCIGCHEDGESTPPNRFAQALRRPSIPLTLPQEKRRSVDFRRDVMPIIAQKCSSALCHASREIEPFFDASTQPVAHAGGAARFNRDYESLLAGVRLHDGPPSPFGKYVHPGRARTSPLIWHVFGKDTSYPWDERPLSKSVEVMPPAGSDQLTDDERQTLVEWIDLGALWDGAQGNDEGSGRESPDRGGAR